MSSHDAVLDGQCHSQRVVERQLVICAIHNPGKECGAVQKTMRGVEMVEKKERTRGKGVI